MHVTAREQRIDAMSLSEIPLPVDDPMTFNQGKPLKILVVEDCEADFELLLATLERQQIRARCQRVMTETQMRESLHQIVPDAIICDHHLPDFSSDRALHVVRDLNLELPFLIVSGTIGEDAAVAAMRAGADDYLIKGRLARLGVALTNAISASRTRRERQVAEERLHQSEAQLRALSGHLITAVEAERTSIARDIHDEIGSSLTAIGLDLAWISRHADRDAADRARQIQGQIAELQRSGQRIVRRLRPPVLDAGLVPALEWQIRRFRETSNIAVRFDSNTPEANVSNTIAIVAYRTLQEALNNVLKHAGASAVSVSLIVQADSLSMEITDNGVGIQGAVQPAEGGFGLRGLTERARIAGGWLDVCANPNSGTSLLLSLPIVDTSNDFVIDDATPSQVASTPGISQSEETIE